MDDTNPKNLSRRRFLIQSSIGIPASSVMSRIGTGTAVIAMAEKAIAQVIPNSNWRSRAHTSTLWAMGLNSAGAVGDGSATPSYSKPVHIGALTKYSAAAVGFTHSLAIRQDGTLWGWGDNSSNQVGLSGSAAYSSPVQVGSATNWSKLSAGNGYSLAIKSDSSLWAWGATTSALGVGDTAGRSSPVQVGTLTNWNQVATKNHTAAIKSDGTLWAWGPNTLGQLGDGTTSAKSSPVQIGSGTYTRVALGPQTTAAIKTDGTLWAWGDLSWIDPTRYYAPQTLNGSGNWAKVSIADSNAHAIKNDGTLWGWGTNVYGQVGDGTTTARYSPVQIGSSTWTSVSDADRYVAAIRSDGLIFTWGYNQVGQLGDGTNVAKSSPVQIGSDTDWTTVKAASMAGWLGLTVALKSTGALWYWGYAQDATLYYTPGQSDTSTPKQYPVSSDWAKYDTGGALNVAIKIDGSLWTWGSGSNRHGELGYTEDFSTFQNRLSGVWRSVACDGGEYSANFAGVLNDGTAWLRG